MLSTSSFQCAVLHIDVSAVNLVVSLRLRFGARFAPNLSVACLIICLTLGSIRDLREIFVGRIWRPFLVLICLASRELSVCLLCNSCHIASGRKSEIEYYAMLAKTGGWTCLGIEGIRWEAIRRPDGAQTCGQLSFFDPPLLTAAQSTTFTVTTTSSARLVVGRAFNEKASPGCSRLYCVALGDICRYYRVSCLSITDPGDSDIIRSLSRPQEYPRMDDVELDSEI